MSATSKAEYESPFQRDPINASQDINSILSRLPLIIILYIPTAQLRQVFLGRLISATGPSTHPTLERTDTLGIIASRWRSFVSLFRKHLSLPLLRLSSCTFEYRIWLASGC